MLRRHHHALRLAVAAAARGGGSGGGAGIATPQAFAAVGVLPIAAAAAAHQQQQQQQHQARRFASASHKAPPRSRWSLSAAAAAAAAAGVVVAATTTAAAAAAPPSSSSPPSAPSSTTSKLFTRAEVRKHRTLADRVWVTHGTSVYDVTDFVAGHPGGAGRLLLAAGGALEPFWRTYPQHHKPYVLKVLEGYRIGDLDPSDAESGKEEEVAADDPYAREPERHPALRPLSLKPYNAETPPELLSASYETPTDLFYVRHHFPVPVVDPKEYALAVQVWDEGEKEEGGGKEQDKAAAKAPRGAPREVLRLTLEELKTRFPRHEITAVMQCTGNRRTEMRDETARAAAAEEEEAKAASAAQAAGGGGGGNDNNPPTPPPPTGKVVGLDWTVGGIGNARWAGARLSDVLRAAGVRDGDPAHAHVHFLGLDGDEAGQQRYAASVPARLVGLGGGGSNLSDALLAYEMNGAELPRDHGYPVRVVVPGVTGARSVKWVSEVLAAPFECQGQWQQRDYKAFSPGMLRQQPTTAATASGAPSSSPSSPSSPDWTSAPPVHEMPISSAICEPAPGTRLPLSDGYAAVKGWAWAGGGQAVIRVDVSPDGGRTWVAARLLPAPGAPDAEAARASAAAQGLEAPFVYPTGQEPGRAWGWTLWEAEVPLPDEAGAGAAPAAPRELELCVKATDSSYNTQPESSLSIWNPRGVVNNAWHRVRVLLVPDEEEEEEEEEEEGKPAAAAAA